MPSCRHRYVILLSSLCYHAAVAISLHCHRYAIPPPSHMKSYHHRYTILPPSYMKSRRRPYAIMPPLLSHCTAIPMPPCRHNNAMTIFPKPYPPPSSNVPDKNPSARFSLPTIPLSSSTAAFLRTTPILACV